MINSSFDHVRIKSQIKKRDAEIKVNSNIKFEDNMAYSALQFRVNNMKVRESDIPMQVLYNQQVDKIKKEDKECESNVRPLIFKYRYGANGQRVGVKVDVIGENDKLTDAQIKRKEREDKALTRFFKSPNHNWYRASALNIDGKEEARP